MGIAGVTASFSVLLKYEKGQEVDTWLPPCLFLSAIVMFWSLGLLQLIGLNRVPSANSKWGLCLMWFRTWFMTFWFVLLVLATLAAPILIVQARAASPTEPAAECTYDQANQLGKLRSIAATKANARLIPHQRQVSWIEKDQTQWSLSYGGCAHFVFSVTASRKRAMPMKQEEVLQAALRMAKAFWDPPDADALGTAIASGKFERRTEQGGTLYAFTRKDYDAFEVEHDFTKGMEQISIRWLRSF